MRYASVAALFAASVLGGCGKSDDADPANGSCLIHDDAGGLESCIEYPGSIYTPDTVREVCDDDDDPNVSWQQAGCPSAGLVGTCRVQEGPGEILYYYYFDGTGHEAACDIQHGTWTPAG